MARIVCAELARTSFFFGLTEELGFAQNGHWLMVVMQSQRTNTIQPNAIFLTN